MYTEQFKNFTVEIRFNDYGEKTVAITNEQEVILFKSLFDLTQFLDGVNVERLVINNNQWNGIMITNLYDYKDIKKEIKNIEPYEI